MDDKQHTYIVETAILITIDVCVVFIIMSCWNTLLLKLIILISLWAPSLSQLAEQL